MDVKLVTVSKLSSEIINVDTIRIEQLVTSELFAAISDKYPTLFRYDDFRLYWRFSQDLFLEIADHFSCVTALRLAADKIIYLVLYDFEEPWDDNLSLLENLDRIEREILTEKAPDVYDVKIGVAQEGVEDKGGQEVGRRLVRTDSDVLRYAVWKEEEVECYTTDLLQRVKLIRDLKRGWPKKQTVLVVPPELHFESRGVKDGAGKKSKTDKEGKKSAKTK